MPWQDTDPHAEQIRFIQFWMEGRATVTYLARVFGISRQTAHRRIKRFTEDGWDGLQDRSHATHTIPHKTPAAVEELAVQMRIRHPFWGPEKLRVLLQEAHPGIVFPSHATIGHILKGRGLTQPGRRRRGTPAWTHPLSHAQAPNDVWCADLKGWFRTQDGARCDPLTVTGAHSRHLLLCRCLEGGMQGAMKAFEELFGRHGLPLAIRTDNGPPFASTGAGGLTALSAWWVRLGIVHERTEPGHPEQNGRHERMHRTLKNETANPPAADIPAQDAAFARFVDEYNNLRPHEALGQVAPGAVYSASPRPHLAGASVLRYPAGTVVRRVRSNGEIKWRGGRVYLSEALHRQPVGLVQEDEYRWGVHYGSLKIGILDDRSGTVFKTPVEMSHISPDK